MSFTVTLHGFIVGLLWVAGFTLAVLNIFIGPAVGALAVGLMLAACTLTICGRVNRHVASWEMAYDVGREVSERVRRLR